LTFDFYVWPSLSIWLSTVSIQSTTLTYVSTYLKWRTEQAKSGCTDALTEQLPNPKKWWLCRSYRKRTRQNQSSRSTHLRERRRKGLNSAYTKLVHPGLYSWSLDEIWLARTTIYSVIKLAVPNFVWHSRRYLYCVTNEGCPRFMKPNVYTVLVFDRLDNLVVSLVVLSLKFEWNRILPDLRLHCVFRFIK